MSLDYEHLPCEMAVYRLDSLAFRITERYDNPMQTCPTCNAPLSERGIFCSRCAVQARCKTGREVLEPDGVACVECGALVEKHDASDHSLEQLSVAGASGRPLMNTLQYSEDKKSRSLRVSLTDQAAESFSGALSMFIAGRTTERPTMPVKRRVLDAHPVLPGFPATDPIDVPEVATDERSNTDSSIHPDQQRLRTIFKYEDDKLELAELRLKAGSKLDYARRLTYLFLYAHELEGRGKVPRESLVDILTKEKIYDTNAGAWIRKTSALKIEEDKVWLSTEGKEKAVITLNESLDPAVPNTWAPDIAGSRSQKSSPAVPTQKSGSNGKRTIINVTSLASKWKAQSGSNTETHNKISKSKTYEQGLFALWAMAKVGGDSCKVVSSHTLSKFLLEAVVIKVDDRNLGRSLERSDAKNKVIKVAGGYQLQPPGATHVELILALDKQKGKMR